MRNRFTTFLLVAGIITLANQNVKATKCYISKTGDDANSRTQAQNVSTAWATITGGISKAVNGDTLFVLGGVYNEANIAVNKRLTILGNTLDDPNGTGVKPIIAGATAAPNSSIFLIQASNITIRNFNIKVDQATIIRGIYAAAGGFNRLRIENNLIQSTNPAGAGSSVFTSFGIQLGQLVSPAGLDTFSITGNRIVPEFSNSSKFGRGIRIVGGSGVIGGLSDADSNEIIGDYGIQAGSISRRIQILNNGLSGRSAAIEINAPAGNNRHLIQNNRLKTWFPLANLSLIEVKNNTLSSAGVPSTIEISNNKFIGHSIFGLFSTRSRNVLVLNNDFIPSDTSKIFYHICVNNKQQTSATDAATPNSITIKGNNFRAPTNVTGKAGTAITFQNHNSGVNPPFVGVEIGGLGNEANTFANGIRQYFLMDTSSGDSKKLPLWDDPNYKSTQMLPVSQNFDLRENLFDLGSGAKLPTALTHSELLELEDRLVHKIDVDFLGFINVVTNSAYITDKSFLLPFTNAPSIQRGVNSIFTTNTWNVFITPGIFPEVVQVDKNLVLDAIPNGTATVGGFKMIKKSKLELDGRFVISDSLKLIGGQIELGNSNLVLASTAFQTGGSDSSFVSTTGTGKYIIPDLGSTPRTFPLGVLNGIGGTQVYSPTTIANTGTADSLKLKINNDVFSNGTFGTPQDTAVGITYELSESIAGGSVLNFAPSWRQSQEKPQFNRNSMFLQTFGTSWSPVNTTPIAATGTDPFTGNFTSVVPSSQFQVLRVASSIIETPGNLYYVDDLTGLDSRSPNEAKNPNTPWKTIRAAIDSVGDGDSIQVFAGNYNQDANIIINKGVKLFGNVIGIGRGVGAGTGIRPTVNGTISGPDSAIFSVKAKNIHIQNFQIVVNQNNIIHGIYGKTSGYNNLTILDNRIISIKANPGPISIPCMEFNSYGIRLVGHGTDSITIKRNFIEPGAFDGSNCVFGRGIKMFGNHGIIGGEQVADSNRIFAYYSLQAGDLKGGKMQILNNFFTGIGVQIVAPAQNSGIHEVRGNEFFSIFPQAFISSLEIRDVQKSGTGVLVTQNRFQRYSTSAIFVQRSKDVTIDNNQFIPADTAQNFRSIYVNTKQLTSATVQNPVPNSITITGNLFKDGAINKGVAIEFANHNDDPNSNLAFTNVQIGGAGNLANTFERNHNKALSLDPFAGPSNLISVLWGTSPVTAMAPVADNFDIQQNLFEVAGGTKIPSAMTTAELYELEDKVQHGIDYGLLGFVTVVPNQAFVTSQSFVNPFTIKASLGRANDKIQDGATIFVQPAQIDEVSTLNKNFTLDITPATLLTIKGIRMNGIGKVVSTDDSLLVADSLRLSAGNIDLGAGSLLIADTTINTGGDANSFIRTTGLGQVVNLNTSNTARIFPVGIGSTYTPLTLINSGTSDNLGVRMLDDVFENGLTGNPVPSVVGATWVLNEGTQGGSNLNATFQWRTSNEKTGFNRNTISLDGFTSSWQSLSGPVPLLATGTDPFTVTSSLASDFNNLPLRLSNVIPPAAGTIYYVDNATGLDTRQAFQAQDPTTPWKTIAKALATVGDGDSIQVFAGTYPESNLAITKKIKLFGNVIGIGKGVGAGTGIRPIVNGTTIGADSSIFTVSAAEILIQNFSIQVDQQNITSGIFAENPGYNQLRILDNQILSAAVNGNTSIPCVRSQTFGITLSGSGTDSITIQRNFIEPIIVNNTRCAFDRGIKIIGCHGLIGGPLASDSNRVLASTGIQGLSFNGGRMTIQNNFLVGNCLEISSPTPNSGTHRILNNRMLSLLPSAFLAQCEIRNFQASGTGILVIGNRFSGHSRIGLFSTRNKNITVTDNEFIPVDTARNFKHIVVNTKQRSTSPNQTPVENGIIIKGNRFRGASNVTPLAGTAIEFGNHNDDPAIINAFTNVLIGGAGTEANIFNSNLKLALRLDENSGQSNTNPFWATQPASTMVPVKDTFDLQENIFEVAGGPKRPANMTENELYEAENKIQHAMDYEELGFVTVIPGNSFVSDSSFLRPLTQVASLQRAHNITKEGWVVKIQPDRFAETVAITKNQTFDAAPSDSVVINSLTMNGASVPVKKLRLADNFTIANSLNLTNPLGGKILLGSANLSINATATITGGEDSCYVATLGTGSLVRRALTNQQVQFPVGTLRSFAPIRFRDNNSTQDNFSVKVSDKAAITDFTPSLPSYIEEFVKFQWDICESKPGGTNAQIFFDWRDNLQNVLGQPGNLNVYGRSVGGTWITKSIPTVISQFAIANGVTQFCNPFAIYNDTAFNAITVDTVINTTNSSVGNSFCSGDTISIKFSMNRNLNAGNVFTAFLYTSPIDSIQIGTLNSIASGTIKGVIPSNIASANCATVRIISDNPVIGGERYLPCIRTRRTPAKPTISNNGSADFCAGESRTLSTAVAQSYSWTPGAILSQSITVTQPGKYTVTITDTSGCRATSDTTRLTLKKKPRKPTIGILSGVNPFCEGSSIKLRVVDSLSTNTNYSWIPSGPSVSAVGSYFLIADSTNGCKDTSAAFVATTTPRPDPFTIQSSPSSTVCEGNRIRLQAPLGFTYSWSGIPGTPIVTDSAIVNQIGIYSATVTITNANNCSRTSPAVSITVRKNPTKPIVDTNATGGTKICVGTSLTFSAIPFTASNTYTWTPAQTTVMPNGNLLVSVSVDSNGCSVSSNTVTYTRKALPPNFSILVGDTNVCADSTILLAGPSGGLFTYIWSGFTPNPGNVSALSVSGVGTYTIGLTIRDSVTKCSRAATTTKTAIIRPIPSKPSISVLSGTIPFCDGDSATLRVNALIAGNTYVWSGVGGPIVKAQGNAFVRSDSTNGCSTRSDAFLVNVNAKPPVPVIVASPSDTICEGATLTLSTVDSLAGFTWSTGGNTSSIQLSDIGTYNITVNTRNSKNCVNASETRQFRIKAAPVKPTITLLGAADICSYDSTIISHTNKNANTSYTWSVPGRVKGDTIFAKLANTYTLNADSNGCVVASNAVGITVRQAPTPVISVSGPTEFCQGGSITLTSNYSNGNTWSNQSTERQINVSTGGNVTLKVDSIGCSATSQPLAITIFPLPTVSAELDNAIIIRESVNIKAIPGTSSTATPFQYNWVEKNSTTSISTQQEFTVTPSKTTTYRVTVTDTNSCSATDTVLVRVTSELWAPNSISPNKDGNNESFKVYGFGVAEIQVRIYNRQGVLVYETNKVGDIVESALDKNSVKGWDGKYKDEDLSGESFIWHITGKLRNGDDLKVNGKNSGSIIILN